MKPLKLALPATVLMFSISATFSPNLSWSQAQASTVAQDTMPAREAATSREDITLTNSCIENGKEKVYCVCVTKIFKNEMTLREYRAAIELYRQSSASLSLIDQGYSADEVSSINALWQDLSSDVKFRTRCDKAETYFSAMSER